MTFLDGFLLPSLCLAGGWFLKRPGGGGGLVPGGPVKPMLLGKDTTSTGKRLVASELSTTEPRGVCGSCFFRSATASAFRSLPLDARGDFLRGAAGSFVLGTSATELSRLSPKERREDLISGMGPGSSLFAASSDRVSGVTLTTFSATLISAFFLFFSFLTRFGADAVFFFSRREAMALGGAGGGTDGNAPIDALLPSFFDFTLSDAKAADGGSGGACLGGAGIPLGFFSMALPFRSSAIFLRISSAFPFAALASLSFAAFLFCFRFWSSSSCFSFSCAALFFSRAATSSAVGSVSPSTSFTVDFCGEG